MPGSQIILSTLNAKYIHASFGLRYLYANMGPLRDRATIVEFEIGQPPLTMVERLLAASPKIIGFGVYIWNVSETLSVMRCLRRIAPEVVLVVGGPEVSYEQAEQAICGLADVVIAGEADLAFPEVCREILDHGRPRRRFVQAPLPDLTHLNLPYPDYTDEDIQHRIVYVEASRGCPFTCEFCLSSLDLPVRAIPQETFLTALDELYRRGVQHFKFVDRTFNLNLRSSRAILEFFLARLRPGLFLHFEMIPDRLPGALREVIEQFPAGMLQFEVGIQTFDVTTSENISRRQNYSRLRENLGFLRERTGVHVHADLIVGLPGEAMESFGEGFDQLIALRPQEIQVGILKRLRGTPIVRHDETHGMVYSAEAPYELLQNHSIDFPTMQRLRRFARFWDLIGNSGNFVESVVLIWAMGQSPFWSFLSFSDWLYEQANRRHGIALTKLVGFLFRFLVEEKGQAPGVVAPVLLRDYQRGGRSDVPIILRDHIESRSVGAGPREKRVALKRQGRHLLAAE